MTYQFPHEVAYLARTKLSYVNLPGILADGKRDRAARVPGFVSIHLGESCYLVFLRAGEAFQAARLRPEGREQLAIAEVLQLAAAEVERGEAGSIGYYGAPQAQLQAMLATFVQPRLVLDDDVDCRHPDRLFPALRERRFDGVVEVRHGGTMQYLCFEEGGYAAGFFCERVPDLPVSERVRSLFHGPAGAPAVGLYPALDRLPEQALPGLIELYRNLLESAARGLAEKAGEPTAVAALRRARAACLDDHPSLAAFEVGDDGAIRGAPLSTPGQLTSGVAAWLVELLGEASLAAGIDPSLLLERSAREGRYVLHEHGFFAQLPWPVEL
jgi:hypothetical protein